MPGHYSFFKDNADRELAGQWLRQWLIAEKKSSKRTISLIRKMATVPFTQGYIYDKADDFNLGIVDYSGFSKTLIPNSLPQ
jgi:hypothetical protein